MATSSTCSFNMDAAVLLCITFLYLPVFVCSLDLGESCTTPNGEDGLCIELDSCVVIRNAVVTGDEEARKFYKKSECGFKNEPLVCCGSFGYPTQTAFETNVLPDRTVCGFEKVQNKVFGGEITEIWEFPWMVLLGYRSNFSDGIEYKCGGTLINNRYVLTAAHCLRINRRAGLTLETVRLGEWRISTKKDCFEDLINEECADPVVDMKIEKLIWHKHYSKKTGNNDIALIKLEANIPYTDYIRPICLPNPESIPPEAGTLLVVSGWGTIENGSLSDIKLKLTVPVVTRDHCAKKVSISGQVTQNQLCAGGQKGKDACKGDSGGPLMGTYGNRTVKKSQWYQEGIISWGIGCGREDFPGIYTRVAKYMDWIIENIA